MTINPLSRYSGWQAVIGLETHVQLATLSKIFSGESTAFGAPPNEHAGIIDLALPGTLPTVNRQAVSYAIRFGLAVEAKIAAVSVFARKNYFYPDLPKGYQISQFEQPVLSGGQISISFLDQNAEKQTKIIQLTRAHLEEDAGKSLHENFSGMSGIDLNRAGTPLLEIVTEPEMANAAEAAAYARTLHELVVWLGICDGNMQEGSFRCDANVSVRRVGDKQLGTRAEIKNLNSFKFLEEAINYEIERQIIILEEGGSILQETRLYDPEKGQTQAMRSKEDANDYRYFPDPDLFPVQIDDAWIDQEKKHLPELSDALQQRLISQYGFLETEAKNIASSREQAHYFETLIANLSDSQSISAIKLAANWIVGELAAQLNRDNLNIAAARISALQLAKLINRITDQTLSQKSAKDLFQSIWMQANSLELDIDFVIEKRGLKQISNSDELLKIIDMVIYNQSKLVDDYHAGKEKAFNGLVGQVMKLSHGQANPQQVTQLLKNKLK